MQSPQVVFPACLTAQQRAALHAAAEESGIPHHSSGTDGERRIFLGEPGQEQIAVEEAGSMADDTLCRLAKLHLHIDLAPFLASTSRPRASKPASKASAKHGRGPRVGESLAESLEEFVARTLPLLDMEKEAEIAQTQAALGRKDAAQTGASGRVLANLRCTDVEGGLLGRTLITLANNKGGGTLSVPLPPHKFSSHDVVDIRPSKAAAGGPPLASGVVFRVRDEQVVVAVEEPPEDGLDQPLRLEKLANEVTYKRLRETLHTLQKAGQGQHPGGGNLPDVLFGRAQPRFTSNPPAWKPVNKSLDDSQVRAVDRALAAQDVALIHGPPGTGKTTAVVELILQEVARGNKVLAAAASNMAVDNLVERLVKAKPSLKLVRVGHPARLLPQVLDSCLDAIILKSDNSALAKDCRKEIKAANVRILKLGRKDYAERRALRGEIKALAKEERQRQQKAVQEVLQGAAVVCSTLAGTLSHNLASLSFDLAVVDEAAQALEASTWSALLKAPRAVLAGDHLQLPPVVVDTAAAQRGLGRTLFERLQGMYGADISQMLSVQYRMHEAIMTWSSEELYGGGISAHPSVANHTLGDLKGCTAGDDEELGPLLLVDTAGCDMEEQQDEDGEDSKSNHGEAHVVMAHCSRLVAAGIRIADIGVITPYNAQVAYLKEIRPPELSALEVGTVDGFQGREKEAIVISMVRSNAQGGIGFLADNRRMNVAVTRARRHCAIVCDTETVSHDAFLKRLVAYFEERAAYISAAELEGVEQNG